MCPLNKVAKELKSACRSTEAALLSKWSKSSWLNLRNPVLYWFSVDFHVRLLSGSKGPRRRWRCNGRLWLSFSMWRSVSLLSSVYPSSQPGGTSFTYSDPFACSEYIVNVTVSNLLMICKCWLKMAEYFPAEDLELYGKVLEQSVSHDDHSTHCSLPWWVNILHHLTLSVVTVYCQNSFSTYY